MTRPVLYSPPRLVDQLVVDDVLFLPHHPSGMTSLLKTGGLTSNIAPLNPIAVNVFLN
jgi:hypothetical protein